MLGKHRLKVEMGSETTGFQSEQENLQRLLDNLEVYGEGNENKEELFRHIRWQLKKMFYLEEKTLSLSLERLSPRVLRALTNQHDKILEACRIVENCKDMRTGVKIRKFQELLKAHFEFEDRFINRFIPAPKSSLSSVQKAPNLGFYPLEQLRKYNKKRMKTMANSNENERNTMKALNKIHMRKLLRSLIRTQKSAYAPPSSK